MDSVFDFDADKFYLGDLCKRGHDYKGTGKSLRPIKRRCCIECEKERREEKQTKRNSDLAHAEGRLPYRRCRCDICENLRKEIKAKWNKHSIEQVRKKRAENPNFDKETYDKNPESFRKASKKYYYENKEKCNATANQYKRDNRDTMLLYSQEYRKNNPEKVKVWKHARRARELNAKGEPYTHHDLKERFRQFDNACAYCGNPENLTLDHVVALFNGGLDEISNIIPACYSCNSSKQISKLEDWYGRQLFFKEERLNKIQSVLSRPITMFFQASLFDSI